MQIVTKVLVTFATRYGSTQEVAEAVTATLRDDFILDVELLPMSEVHSHEGYRAVVLGMPLYVGSWPNDTDRFLFRHRVALTREAVAIFALGPIDRNEESQQASREQLARELANYRGLPPSQRRSLSANMIRQSCAFLTTCSLGCPQARFIRRQPATCATGRQFAPGRAR